MNARADAIHTAEDEDFDIEPVPGLPEELPEGERVLWSGVPSWLAIAYDVFHLRAIAVYAAIIVAWRFGVSYYDGAALGGALLNAALLGGLFLVGLALIVALAFATAKSTRYTITNHRVVMRIGVALTMSINLPFKQIISADYRPAPFGTGAIALSLATTGGLGYLALWPHARPFRFANPQPMLRGIRDGERVAGILARALRAEHGARETSPIHVTAPAQQGAAAAAA